MVNGYNFLDDYLNMEFLRNGICSDDGTVTFEYIIEFLKHVRTICRSESHMELYKHNGGTYSFLEVPIVDKYIFKTVVQTVIGRIINLYNSRYLDNKGNIYSVVDIDTDEFRFLHMINKIISKGLSIANVYIDKVISLTPEDEGYQKLPNDHYELTNLLSNLASEIMGIYLIFVFEMNIKFRSNLVLLEGKRSIISRSQNIQMVLLNKINEIENNLEELK